PARSAWHRWRSPAVSPFFHVFDGRRADLPDAVRLAHLRRQVAVSLNGAHKDRPLSTGCVMHDLVPGRRYAGHRMPPSTVRTRRATTAESARARWARGEGGNGRPGARPGPVHHAGPAGTG